MADARILLLFLKTLVIQKTLGQNFQRMLSQPVAVGKNVFHILNSIKDKPYEVVDIITTEQLEQVKTMDDIIQKSRPKNHKKVKQNGLLSIIYKSDLTKISFVIRSLLRK